MSPLAPVDTAQYPLPRLFSEHVQYLLKDHALLRSPWSNLAQVQEGVWRSNQPSFTRLMLYREMGIRHILSLRGSGQNIPFRFLSAFCHELGLELYTLPLSAREPPALHDIGRLFEAFRSLPRPFLMHCKSGADRTGFAAALLLLSQGRPLAEAQRQLSPRFLHFKATKSGILDEILLAYAEENARSPLSIEDWLAHFYSPARLAARFENRSAQGWTAGLKVW